MVQWGVENLKGLLDLIENGAGVGPLSEEISDLLRIAFVPKEKPGENADDVVGKALSMSISFAKRDQGLGNICSLDY